MDGIDDISANEALQSDEIEALSAIFEKDFALESIENKEYSITVHNSSKQSVYLQFKFPPTYPSHSPPTYLISAPWLNRDAKNHLALAMDEVYCENLGESIIFLWIERIKDFIEDSVEKFEAGKLPTELFAEDANNNAYETLEYEEMLCSSLYETKQKGDPVPSPSLFYSLDIAHGEKITEKKSIFQAHVARVSSVKEVNEVLGCLMEDKKIASATHNIMAYRINQANILIHDCNDDGEAKAGSNLLHLLELLDVCDVVVVVSRWYGGIHLGADRFKLINSTARNLLETEGFIKQKTAVPKKGQS